MSEQRAYMILWQNMVGGEVDRNYVICLGQEDDCIALTDAVKKMVNKYGPTICGGDTIRVVELNSQDDIPKGSDYTVVRMPPARERKNLREFTISSKLLAFGVPEDWVRELVMRGFIFESTSCPIKFKKPWEQHNNPDGSVTWRQWDGEE